MTDVGATGKTKRWREQMALLQNALRAHESINRAQEALGNIIRLLVEDQSEEGPAVGTMPPRSAERPTVFQPALTNDVFANLCRRRFAEARTDDQRQAVRDLVRTGREKRVLSDDEATSLELELT